jgi:ankyrin repeat domain-containing protein 50
VQQDNFEKVAPGTGAWFKTGREFGQWLTADGAVLWARGMRKLSSLLSPVKANADSCLWSAGAGKSVITSMVVDIVEKKAKESGSVSVAYAYCRYSDAEDRVTIRSVLAGLVRQLLARHPSVLDIVEPVYREHQHDKTQATQSQLVGLLRDISARFDVNFRALDGVDELTPEVRHKLLQALVGIGGNLFVSSRPLPELEDSLSEAAVVEVVAHDEDVALMVTHEIDQFPRFRDLLGLNAGPEKKERAIKMIQERSHGM